MAINGNNILIYSGGSVIAATRSNSISVKGKTIEIASATSGQWEEYIAGRKSWSFTTSFLVTGMSDIVSRLKTVGSSLTIVIRGRGAGSALTGTAICEQCQVDATRGSLVNGSFSFRGSGELKETTVG